MKQTESLTENWQFKRLYDRGKHFSGRLVVVYALKNRTGCHRLGITVSRKFGCAVRRNRARRLIREAFRLEEHTLTDRVHQDLVVVARNRMQTAAMQEVRRELAALLRAAGLTQEVGK